MDRKRVIFIAVALLSALVFYQLYQNTIIYWDGYGIEVTETTDADPGQLIPLTPEELEGFPAVAGFFDEASQSGFTMVTDVMGMEQFYSLLRSKGHDLDVGHYYLDTGDTTYRVEFAMYGGMDDQPLYLYLAGAMVVLAAALAVEGLRTGKLP